MSTELHPILDSPKLAVTVQLARKSALTPGMPILIQGEAGAGAEELARFIHGCSDEGAVHPFVAVKCPGISEATLESELFGPSEAGTPKPAITRARGGTLFIEEISISD
jgi:DNA-binding NtrC family response regulator